MLTLYILCSPTWGYHLPSHRTKTIVINAKNVTNHHNFTDSTDSIVTMGYLPLASTACSTAHEPMIIKVYKAPG